MRLSVSAFTLVARTGIDIVSDFFRGISRIIVRKTEESSNLELCDHSRWEIHA